MLIANNKIAREWDAFSIKEQQIDSLSLLKRASLSFTNYFINLFPHKDIDVTIFCGSGNNGADGIAVAINLDQAFYNVTLYLCQISNPSKEQLQMREELKKYSGIAVYILSDTSDYSQLRIDDIVVDALFGSGLSRPIEGIWAQLVDTINAKAHTIVSIDTPSGLSDSTMSAGSIIKADYCGCFQAPNLSQLISENGIYVGNLTILDIGLSAHFHPMDCTQYYITNKEVSPLLKKRSKHQHKGDFGHVLALCGSKGMAGAAVLSAKACLRSGVGKLTVAVPESINDIIQISVPEAMTLTIQDVAQKNLHFKNYNTLACGCGIGISDESINLLDYVLNAHPRRLVLDADALNIIAKKNWNTRIPQQTILTPHIKEFDRLFGPSSESFERFEKAKKLANQMKIYIVLKGAYTCTSTPDGKQFFNASGNPGMATAGTGDILTGIIAGLLAQNYDHAQACIIGVYLHGMAGDLALQQKGEHALLASDLIDNIARAYNILNYEKN